MDEREEDGGGHQEGADEDGGRLRRDEEADEADEKEDECRKPCLFGEQVDKSGRDRGCCGSCEGVQVVCGGY